MTRYDDGVAFFCDLPAGSRLGNFVLTNELTEFRFADDFRHDLSDKTGLI